MSEARLAAALQHRHKLRGLAAVVTMRLVESYPGQIIRMLLQADINLTSHIRNARKESRVAVVLHCTLG
ncbi:hypothetical protein WOLCODRAFT_27428 [Wolfiporia cocos MD-104 SS10]|uniref:Uncharacterized protein n=1 Tax=Wolfiporia cocos (strain MD-104) TaxID=742152 RepID=A0A2H3JAQ4_WOLCO|nr:hypothetical protein WOLCODRAFT_27428 [Wolfiporia cocos MD-104 SS10]